MLNLAPRRIDAAKKQIAQNRFDLALLDLGLPGGCGSELIALLKSVNPSALCNVHCALCL